MALLPEFFPDIEEFQWDEGNSSKTWARHQVSRTEAEQVLLNRPVVVTDARSSTEARHFAFGRTDGGRFLTVVFTIRGPYLRVISARPMSRPEEKAMTKRPARPPTFKSEAEERQFWEAHDTSPFVDWNKARVAVFPNLKPSTETISLRLPAALLAELKALANKRDVPYQSLLKVFLAERIARETYSVSELPDSPGPTKVRRRTRRPRTSR